MHTTTFVIGGCRSGKSRHALQIAEASGVRRKLFIATCIPRDDEMKARVRRHQQERGETWQTIEVPTDLAPVIADKGDAVDIVLVDCPTLWLSNLMLSQEGNDAVHSSIDELCHILSAPPCPVILVSNEVGAGIVPENALARRYRDIVGRANQQVAAACRQVIWMVAGIAVPIKSLP